MPDPSSTMELPHMVAALAAAARRGDTGNGPTNTGEPARPRDTTTGPANATKSPRPRGAAATPAPAVTPAHGVAPPNTTGPARRDSTPDRTAVPPAAPAAARATTASAPDVDRATPSEKPAVTQKKPRRRLPRRVRKALAEPAPPVKGSAVVAATSLVDPSHAPTTALPALTATAATPVGAATAEPSTTAVSGTPVTTDAPTERDDRRTWARRYGWAAAAGGIAVVLLCSLPFVSNRGPAWNSADPTGTATTPGTATVSAPVVAPVTATPSASPSPKKPSPTVRASTVRPTPRRTPSSTPPRRPALLGPASGQELFGMLNDYCRSRSPRSRAWLRDWQGAAENNWHCRERDRPEQMIDMTAACVQRYGKGAVARYTNRNDATSWRCYR
ncbi:hypothetical protein [Micromonospora pattaloongensis]|uniref:hypothetical protein n=1 Tax=Micromonospora pattaloongensis TaxID=405436 RepID=UPI00111509F4|nr:hypothetical protein [Micromonospora pattaloongensis]